MSRPQAARWEEPRGPAPGAIGHAALSQADLWDRLGAAYVEVWRQREASAADPVATAVAGRVRLAMTQVGPPAGPEREADDSLPVNPTVQDWAIRAARLLASDGAPARPVRFDRLRTRLVTHGFNRAEAWDLCVALRRAGVIRSEPDRPYLNGPGQRLADQLLSTTGLRVRSAEDLEAGLMIVGETRLASVAPGRRLDAEVLTEACRQLARALAHGHRASLRPGD